MGLAVGEKVCGSAKKMKSLYESKTKIFNASVKKQNTRRATQKKSSEQ